MYDVGTVLDYDKFKDRSSTGPVHIAQYIFAKVLELDGPVFVHFDEIGDLAKAGLPDRAVHSRSWVGGLGSQAVGLTPHFCLCDQDKICCFALRMFMKPFQFVRLF